VPGGAPTRLLVIAALLAAVGAPACGGGGGDGSSRGGHGADRDGPAARFVAPDARRACDCSRRDPCASLARALDVAKPGEVVEIAAGTYPEQQLTGAARPPSGRPVVFRPASGARVEIGGLVVGAQDVELERLEVTGLYVDARARDVVLRELTVKGALFITSAARISVLGGSVGPGTDVSSQIKAESGSTTPPRDIRIEGVAFHDFTRSDPSAHVECLHVMAVERLTLRGNSFSNCEAFDVLFTKFGETGSPRDILIENNTFSCCRSGFYSVFLGGGHGEIWEDVLVRNNSADRGFSVSQEAVGPRARVRFLSNVAPGVNPLLCGLPGVEWDYNVWSEGRPCGPNDRVAASGFRNAAAGDFRLRRGAAAIGSGHPRSVPRVDADGRRRPQGGRPDAGAFEY
jgi:hypothetical protein